VLPGKGGQGKAGRGGNREPACWQIMVIMDSILMMILMLMTMTVMMVSLATCELLLASCNLVITIAPCSSPLAICHYCTDYICRAKQHLQALAQKAGQAMQS